MKKIFYLLLVAASMAACNQPAATNNTDSQVAKNKALFLKFNEEVFNKHNVALIDSLCAANFVDHSADSNYGNDREGLKKSFVDFFAAFPDVHVTTDFTVAEGDMVTAHEEMTGTNTGPMMGAAPTNKKMDVRAIDIVKFKDGQCTEHWGYMEEMKLMKQMGMMPPMDGDSTKAGKKK